MMIRPDPLRTERLGGSAFQPDAFFNPGEVSPATLTCRKERGKTAPPKGAAWLMRSSSREALILEGNALFKKSGEMPSASSIFSLLRASPSTARATQSRVRSGLRLLAAGLWQALHALAGPDVVFCEPPAWHLEGIGDLWESAWHRAFVVRFQVVEFHDRAVRGDVGDG